MALVNKSQIKEVAGEYRVSVDFYDALDALIARAVEQAKKRAESNHRTTLMAHDL